MDVRVLGGRYELGPALGSGGFGTVYRARDRPSGAEVAVKVVPRGLGADHVAYRLRREALALRRIASSHVARILDFGEDDDGTVYLVTELVANAVHLSADELGRPLLPHEALRAARSLLEGLAAAHAAGVAHGDVKPANVLVPRGPSALDGLKIIDFGLARVSTRASLAEDAGEDLPREGLVFGTARWMAPEVLRGADVDARSDLYSAGLVLFELLGCGPLFPGDSPKAQLRARLVADPVLDDRVPAPISIVLARLLARDPTRRYRDAGEAHTTVCDLDTAPVAIYTGPRVSSGPPASIHPRSSTRPRSERSQRLTSLPADGHEGLRETLRRLDMPMLDALARRERGNSTGRLARAVALALRLELDAAALILEPLTAQSDLARAVGATILAPRARRVTRARVDSDPEDSWIETVPAELAALLAALGATLGRREAAARDVSRGTRLLARLERTSSSPSLETARATLRVAVQAARVRAGELTPAEAIDLVAPFVSEMRDVPALERIVRSMAHADIASRIDESRARDDLERAERVAAETGTTLLDACAATALGSLLVSSATRLEQGIAILERASTLLAHGDAPTLEHEAEHHMAAALVVQGRWEEAIEHLRAAREAAHAERAVDLEIASASLEIAAHLAVGQSAEAHEAAETLGDARIASTKGRAAALAWVARSLEALAAGEIDPAEDALTEAEARVRDAAEEPADAHVLVEIVGMILDAGRGALPDVEQPAAELERFAREHGFVAFYWFDVLRAVVARVDEPVQRRKMEDVLTRLTALLGPQSRLARERKTSAPPSAVL